MSHSRKHHRPPPRTPAKAVEVERGPRPARRILMIAIAGALVISLVLAAVHYRLAHRSARPHDAATGTLDGGASRASLDQYAGSASCKACHASAYEHWSHSHHALAERPWTPELDRPAFDPPTTFQHATQSTHVRMEKGEPQVVSLGLSGKPEAHAVLRVIGADPLRQYLVDAPNGRLQTLEASYDPNLHQWFNVNGSEDRQPGEWGHWTGRAMTWNAMCAACHNTRLLKNYDVAADAYRTQMAEMSVACEACHGPMKPHVQWQQSHGGGAVYEAATKSPKEQGPPASGTGFKDPTLVRLSRAQITDTCASCHARRGDLTGNFVPGDSFFDHYALTGVDASDLFYADGQIHDEDYEYSAFSGSKMHAAGVRCIDCHDVHSGKTLLAGNALCMTCHAGANPKAPLINPAQHTFHKPDSAGSQCVNCHMPQTVYMQRHSRHDHGFTTPDPMLTKTLGIPNACNRCHKDKDADWTLAAAEKWYGAKLDRPARKRATIIAAGRRGDDSARAALLAQLNDPNETYYWKSAYITLLSRWLGDPAVLGALLQQLHAEHPMTREAAASAIAPAQSREEVAAGLRALLDDPSRNVRIAAAHALGASSNPAARATREFIDCLSYGADNPIGRLQLAINDAMHQNTTGALAHLQKALEFDSHSASLCREAAMVYGNLGRPTEALAELTRAAAIEPNNAEYAYLQGLAANEAGQPVTALSALERAVKLDPRLSRAAYNLALARRDAGQSDAALAAFAMAEKADPNDPDIVYAKASLLLQLGRADEARQAAQRALQIRPDYAPAKQLLEQVGQTQGKPER